MSWDQNELTSGPLPLWWQIADRLRKAIEAGDFKPGEALPSESRLNEVFGVSRTTARAALDRLEQEGLIVRRSGKGSLVLAPQVEQPLTRLSGFAEDMRQRGLTASYRTLTAGFERASAEAAEALGIAPETDAFRIYRLLIADGRPMAACLSWIPAQRLGNRTPTTGELDSGSLYAWLETHCGARIVAGSEMIEAAIADPAVADVLDIPAGSATLVARRRGVDGSGEPVEYAVVRFRADRYRFRVDLVRE
ncbi:GntR family transcriptional regulator [Pseudoxanthobacter soli DSM 19599]|uniref:GntR family transcriptional regulator n=1 Tax=Pseudoxanthobacter soli DSM 19599 TaxID=1123029 RepID=A0A1M7ZL52_9HYPH|nr:GntR family transcriptional regulator [Pseudoxanthobacter soli]SHO65630.1 GntR family transcriptional regulator [Pseudoxanthobacter soli DSM 19599]